MYFWTRATFPAPVGISRPRGQRFLEISAVALLASAADRSSIGAF
jgi:hypothetical protein